MLLKRGSPLEKITFSMHSLCMCVCIEHSTLTSNRLWPHSCVLREWDSRLILVCRSIVGGADFRAMESRFGTLEGWFRSFVGFFRALEVLQPSCLSWRGWRADFELWRGDLVIGGFFFFWTYLESLLEFRTCTRAQFLYWRSFISIYPSLGALSTLNCKWNIFCFNFMSKLH